jgi:hypothetical protein
MHRQKVVKSGVNVDASGIGVDAFPECTGAFKYLAADCPTLSLHSAFASAHFRNVVPHLAFELARSTFVSAHSAKFPHIPLFPREIFQMRREIDLSRKTFPRWVSTFRSFVDAFANWVNTFGTCRTTSSDPTAHFAFRSAYFQRRPHIRLFLRDIFRI